MTPQQFQLLQRVVAQLDRLEKSDRYTFLKTLQLLDGRNIQVGTGTGTSFGTETTQKLSLYGVTPVIQASAISAPSTPSGTYSQAEAQSAVDAINNIRAVIGSSSGIGITA